MWIYNFMMKVDEETWEKGQFPKPGRENPSNIEVDSQKRRVMPQMVGYKSQNHTSNSKILKMIVILECLS